MCGLAGRAFRKIKATAQGDQLGEQFRHARKEVGAPVGGKNFWMQSVVGAKKGTGMNPCQ
jgi:hypothetical protein